MTCKESATIINTATARSKHYKQKSSIRHSPKTLFDSVSAVVGRTRRRRVLVAQGQVIEDFTHALQRNHVVFVRTMRHTW